MPQVGPAYPPTSTTVGPSPQGAASHLPPSPEFDGSCSTMSSSLPSLSSISRRTNDLSLEGTSDSASARSIYMGHRAMQQMMHSIETANASHLPSYQNFPGPIGPAAQVMHEAQPLLSPTHYQQAAHAMHSQTAYNETPLTTFSSFSTPYPTYAGPQSEIPAYYAENISPSATLAPVMEDDCEADVVPASAPLDERGQVPFIFDPTYEAQNIIRLRHTIASMQDGAKYQTAEVADSSNLGDANWKGYGNMSTSSYIPDVRHLCSSCQV